MQSILNNNIDSYPNIDWSLIAVAKEYYASLGYQYVETPWMVPTYYTEKTKPSENKSFVLDSDLFENQNNELVGSAEQGFLYLIDNHKIPPGKYCSISPCFRVEAYDSLHQPWFLKLELIDFKSVNENSLNNLMLDAFNLFQKFTQGNLEIINLSNNTYDINLNNVEIGSYGIRNINNTGYVYGTGLALPRFSMANNLN